MKSCPFVRKGWWKGTVTTRASRRKSSPRTATIICRYYRQQDLFAGSGWTPSRGTLLNIAAAAGDLLPLLIDYFRQEVLGERGRRHRRHASHAAIAFHAKPMPVQTAIGSRSAFTTSSPDAMREGNKPSVTGVDVGLP